MPNLRIIGPGRAGLSLAGALTGSEFNVVDLLGRHDSVADAAVGVDLVVITTPDRVIAEVAAAISASRSTVIAHMSGSLGLDVLGGHRLRAAVHPLVALPDAATGARRLRENCWFAVAGDSVARDLVRALGGRPFEVADHARALYHAAAVISSNHLVALLGQAERVAGEAGVPFEAILDLARTTLDSVTMLGPATALTGPAARGDEATIARHLEALGATERSAYEVMAEQARRLAGRGSHPPEESGGRS